MQTDTRRALLDLAQHAAEQLVAAAMRDLVTGVAGPVVVTIHPQTSAPRLLGDGKPPKRKYAKRAKSKPTPSKAKAAPKAATTYASTPLAERKCRNCLKAGTASRVPNTPRTVKCSACDHRWDVRGLADDVAPAKKQTKACRSCAHDSKHHIEMVGMCSVRGCACESFK